MCFTCEFGTCDFSHVKLCVSPVKDRLQRHLRMREDSCICLHPETPDVNTEFSPQSYCIGMRARSVRARRRTQARMSDPKASSSNPSGSSANAATQSRREYYTRRDASKVYLFEVFPRWREFKKRYGLESDADVAQRLLDAFESAEHSRQDLW